MTIFSKPTMPQFFLNALKKVFVFPEPASRPTFTREEVNLLPGRTVTVYSPPSRMNEMWQASVA